MGNVSWLLNAYCFAEIDDLRSFVAGAGKSVLWYVNLPISLS